MPAKWRRVIPLGGAVGQIQAVQAKKHLTVFGRSPRAPGAGSPGVKAGFTACAKQTLGEPDSNKRIASVQTCMKGKGLKTGVYHKKSRARIGSQLHGTIYTTGGK